MAKMRVHQIAKELGLASKDAVDMLTQLGVDVRNHASTIEDADAAKLRGLVRNGSATPAAAPPPAPAPPPPPAPSPPPAPAARSASRRDGGGRCRTGRSSGSQRDHCPARRLGHRLRRQDRQVP